MSILFNDERSSVYCMTLAGVSMLKELIRLIVMTERSHWQEHSLCDHD